eukprot:TRINITY_DN36253_c0_g2_i1.p1 TRINITY_DN36253_c0_g2~~TRINITY_DN36253_c0_g2_i1.p1  ORF type:complete len:127 (-),score=14.69 TRINITY_DN36253_c0_g2_i1:18-398(-)
MSFRSGFQLTRFELLVEDLRMLLARFAYEESFSEFSKGGGRESNVKLVPYMIQMGLHLYQTNLQEADRQRVQEHLTTQLNLTPDHWISTKSKPDEPDFEEQNQDALEIGRAVQQECRDRSRMPSSA